MTQWKFGENTIDRVVESEMPRCVPSVLLPDVTPEIVERHRHWLEPYMLDPNTGQLILYTFVIRTPRSTILAIPAAATISPGRRISAIT
ncbi:MAG: hypothetical protein HY661_14345 [Betaproteobacteria bacterium]|nr:hypothetical protein [Betaproteobacteria bacterium]